MATLRIIRRRIKSIKNISQVTRAMEMVAASKMRRAQQATVASRAYSEKAREVLAFVSDQPGSGRVLHPLLEERRAVKNIAVILIAGDRGLCGSYNANIYRAAMHFMREENLPTKLITIGRRTRDFAVRRSMNLIGEFTGFSERPAFTQIGPIARIVIEEFTSGKVDEVYIAYTDFVNVITQRPTIRRILPVRPEKRADAAEKSRAVYLYEPDPETLLASILPRFTEIQIYQAVLESVASEHSARMVAMRNASDNAHELIDSLTLEANKARQTAITKEMLDIAGGAEALRQAMARA
ncbi:MAG: ATP synthase F1 subunit gamma [Chloroflexi bacterium]|nr:ATP synthase F1 subunit gamma [Chloroflexota bacterium]